MARGYLKDKEYRMADIRAYILELMKEKKVRQWQIAVALDMTQARVSQKLDACDFNISELLTIFELLGADKEKVGRLFTIKEEK